MSGLGNTGICSLTWCTAWLFRYGRVFKFFEEKNVVQEQPQTKTRVKWTKPLLIRPSDDPYPARRLGLGGWGFRDSSVEDLDGRRG